MEPPPNTLESILNYLAITPELGTAGQPSPEQFAAVRAAGYEVVLNLLPPVSTAWNEAEESIVEWLGMQYVHIPVIWENPQQQDLARFFAALDANTGRKIFVHCAMNMRVSAFIFLYRVLRRNEPLSIAKQDLHKIWQPDGVWLQFIEQALHSAGKSIETE